jgi:hypothetical protein
MGWSGRTLVNLKIHFRVYRGSGVAVAGVDIGKNSFHVVGRDSAGPVVLWQKWRATSSKLSQAVIHFDGE